MSEQGAAEQASTAPVSAQVGGLGDVVGPAPRAGRGQGGPPEYQRILAVVQQAAGPVMTRQVGETLGLDTGGGATWSRCVGS
ncbi:hypothetical protein [Streptomyces mirabilis]|jgi:hypothetical protein|uniref:Uncharacterized protein n=1 Tax=Streptomyces mirabilis TaxID=68239 RepID=A0A1I2WYB5_9ACTN|nr:hypothetical protein [Streptomyces mirabilis]SFH06172.1 hypothetical protein SAMN02787118_14111 [Streptomyces mirabilis]